MHANARILTGKSIVLGVCGGIAAYKSVLLLRLLKKAEADVRVVMTRNAGRFVGPVTFQALSDRPVFQDLFTVEDEAAIRHIQWAQEADAVVVAPATANFLGKLAGGIADDALSTFMMAVACPVMLCPSMNTQMYESRAVQRNLETLRGDGCLLLEPGAGELACGTTGPGRLPEPEQIYDRLESRLTPKDLTGRTVLVTAGPTYEYLDPVRFIGNPSSGKMGFAVARAAEARGARVVLVAGPTALDAPANVATIRVKTAGEMAEAVFAHFDEAHIVIKAAAVADYRPKESRSHKIKKDRDTVTLELEKNTDILRELGQRKKGQVLVGFAAETRELEANARKKIAAKNLDLIVGNIVGGSDAGFQTDTNRVDLFFPGGRKEALPLMDKRSVAHCLLDRILAVGRT